MKLSAILISVLVVIVVAAVAAYGGYTLGTQAGLTQAGNAQANFFAARGGQGGAGGAAGAGGGFPGAAAGGGGTGTRGQGGAGGQFNPANFATGQVKQIDGNTIQLSTATDVLTVKINDQTQIQKTGAGTVGDLQPGERIVVQGTRGSDGTFTAQSVQIGRAGGGPPPGAPAGTPTPGN
jgi:hypothetical protein